MPTLEAAPLFWTTKLIAVAVLLQGIEILQLRRTFAPDGIWRWETVRKEFLIFPRPLRTFFNLTLDYPRFLFVLVAQIVLALAALALPAPHPAILAGLLFTHALIAVRWRGTFNGGADYMTTLTLLLLTVYAFAPTHRIVELGCLWYLAVQAVLSYTVAGLVKLRNADWRRGRALQKFLVGPPYDPPELFAAVSKNPQLAVIGSWTILLFEVSFPLALLNPKVCTAYIAAALVFHLLNVATFGLNRFLFAWAATYPALYFCSAQKIFG
jgi:hypothetical protein